MRAEIIGVGTELLLGHTINSDAAFVARELSSHGIDLMHTQVVGDNPARLEEALRQALERNDLVITTGGLGPTKDDLTKETIARVANAPLALHEPSLKNLKAYFGDRPMSDNQIKQAYMPAGAEVFQNMHGTAPGCAVQRGDGIIIIMLPGPPSELVPMLEGGVRAYLASLCQQAICSRIIRTFGIGEGQAAQIIDKLTNLANPTVATYAAEGEMFVKVTAKAANREEAEKIIGPVSDEVRKLLGNVVYGMDVPSLDYVVVKELIARSMSIATAESCTGGLLAKKITDQPGASAIFHFGAVTYANDAKEKFLGVSPETLRKYGAVSGETALEMANGIRKAASSDLGIGITGIAGPDGGTPQKPVGLVYICLATDQNSWIRRMWPQGRYPGRAWIRNRATGHALDMVRRYLNNLPVVQD